MSKLRYEAVSRDGQWWVGALRGSREVGSLQGPYTKDEAHAECRRLNGGKPAAAPRVQIVHDTNRNTPDLGGSYCHCGQCLDERPSDISPRDFARQQLSIAPDGRLQLRCTRHDLNITTMTFEVAED